MVKYRPRARIRVRDPDEFERWRQLIKKARQRREKNRRDVAVHQDARTGSRA